MSRRLTAAELEEIKGRHSLEKVVGEYTKLRKLGGRLVGACPFCGGNKGAQRFEILDKGASWTCAVCPAGGDIITFLQKAKGLDFRGAIEWLGGELPAADPEDLKRLQDAHDKKRAAREKTEEKFREAERKRLWKVWEKAFLIHNTRAQAYLEGRGMVVPDDCPGLRCADDMPYFHGEEVDERGRRSPIVLHRGPAMVAAFIRPDGRFGGLHITWITESAAPVKIELHDPETGELLKPKKMRGSKSGAHIWLTGPKEPTRLFVAEGIETIGSVYTAMVQAQRAIEDTAFWAAGDLGNMAGRSVKTVPHPKLKRPNGRAVSVPNDQPDPDDPGLSIPDSVEELILLGDGDSEPVLTEYAMTRAARRYAREGRIIRIAFAPAGQDFNDVLRGAA